MREVDRFRDPESGVEYRVKEGTRIDLERRIADHQRWVSSRSPGGLEVTHGADMHREVDRLVGRLPGDPCFERCICSDGVHREPDDEQG